MAAVDGVEHDAKRLICWLEGYQSAAVAFSGGVDSTVVAKAARLALGAYSVAVTGVSPSVADGELEAAQRLAREIGIRHIILQTNELQDPRYVENDGRRCYHCKNELYGQMVQRMAEWGVVTICSGANLDDLGDYRPGLEAAAELAIRHPLQEVGFGKERVRRLAAHWGLENFDKPATPCLSSRLAVGVEVTPERLLRIDKAEQFLRQRGFSPVRVRYHEGDHARIEVSPEQLPRLVAEPLRQQLAKCFHELGFRFVSVDVEGFRSGAMNVLVPSSVLENFKAKTDD